MSYDNDRPPAEGLALNRRTWVALLLAFTGLFVLGLGAVSWVTRADAASPDLEAEPGAVECWGHGKTLVHVIVRNTGDATGRYQVTVERADRTDTWKARLGPGKAVQDGYQLRRGETVQRVTVRAVDTGYTLYHRADVRALARCAR